MRAAVVTSFLVALAGCTGPSGAPTSDAGFAGDGASQDARPGDAGAADAPLLLPGDDAGHAITGIAPEGAVPGETRGVDGAEAIAIGPGDRIVRVDVAPSEHVTFFLTFAPDDLDVVLEVLRWDGSSAVSLGATDAGLGVRTLAAFDPSGPRTFWARLRTTEPSALDATLTITRVPFEDGASCGSDCDHLLQLPLPNDPGVDGYDHTSATVFRYQYGRRDLVMFLRHAGRSMRAAGLAPFVPEDLSQWDGMTPGTDVDAPRHSSHQRGKDVDLSLYGVDGRSVWRSFCTTEDTSAGRECIAGTETDFDGMRTARMVADLFATGRVTMCFLDRELHATLIAGAHEAVAMGLFDASLEPLFADGVHIQHWPNHDNHIHVRVSEVAGSALTFGALPAEPFEAP